MTRSGETQKSGQSAPFDFSLSTKKQMAAKRKAEISARSETLRYEFERLRQKIDWEQMRTANSEADVNSALEGIDQFDRDRLPCTPAILATVREDAYPKLRPIRFLAESCALALYENPKSAEEYSPRYSRDICYEHRTQRGPAPKPMSNLEYWRMQADLGQRVPVRFLRRINKEQAKERRKSVGRNFRALTYTDIPERIGEMKKKRTTVWLPEATIAKLKKLSAMTGAPMAELFRRAVEAYLQEP
jgi:hypothetical protein